MALVILIGILGVVVTGIGALSMLMAFMPKWGGGNDAWAFPFGLATFTLGLVLIFSAGAML